MKIAVPIQTEKDNSQLSLVFARSKYYAIFNTANQDMEVIENPYYSDNMRVGENVAWLLSQKQVKGYLAYEFGQKLQNLATKNKIQLILVHSTVRSLRDLEKLTQKS